MPAGKADQVPQNRSSGGHARYGDQIVGQLGLDARTGDYDFPSNPVLRLIALAPRQAGLEGGAEHPQGGSEHQEHCQRRGKHRVPGQSGQRYGRPPRPGPHTKPHHHPNQPRQHAHQQQRRRQQPQHRTKNQDRIHFQAPRRQGAGHKPVPLLKLPPDQPDNQDSQQIEVIAVEERHCRRPRPAGLSVSHSGQRAPGC